MIEEDKPSSVATETAPLSLHIWAESASTVKVSQVFGAVGHGLEVRWPELRDICDVT